MAMIDELPNVVARPIRSAEPAGEDATYDDAFLDIKARIDGLGTLSGGIDQERVLLGDAESVFDPADRAEAHRFIVDTGKDLLLHRTKDVRVGCYVTLSLFHTEGPRGLVCGLEVLSTLVSTFGDAIYPRRARARNAALTFLATRLGEALDPTRSSGLLPSLQGRVSDWEAALEALQNLECTLSEHIDAYSASLAPLERRLSEARQASSQTLSPSDDRPEDPENADLLPSAEVAETAPEPEVIGAKITHPEAPRSDETRPVVPPPAHNPADPRPADEPASWSAIVRMAGQLREDDRTDLRPYDILRSVRWGRVDAAPVHQERVTQIEPPLRQRRDRLQRMLRTATTPTAINTAIDHAEDAFQEPPFHFWLTLQHELLRVMERAGDGFSSARECVARSLGDWVDRIPSIVDLSFADGTPFADDDTRRWLRTLGPAPPSNAAEPVTDDAPNGGVFSVDFRRSVSHARDFRRSVSHARHVLRSGGLKEALNVLESGRRGRGERSRLLHRLAQSRLCLDAGRASLARSILEAIDHRLRASPTMLAYDLDLALDVWCTLHRCYDELRSDLLRQDIDDSPALSDLHDRIERVDDQIAAHDLERVLDRQSQNTDRR